MNSKYVIERSKDSYEILKVNKDNKWVYIGSKYNEEREINRFIKNIGDKTSKDIYVVFGLGMANHINELIRLKHNNSKVIVVEFEKAWVIEFNKKSNFTRIDNTYLVSDYNEFNKIIYDNLNEYNVDHIKVLSYANYDKLYNVEIEDYYKFLLSYIAQLRGNINTRLHFAETLFNSTIDNLRFLPYSRTINEYKNKHKDKPAIIVSAGPSLSKNINLLKNNMDAVIIGGGRTLKSLINVGIKPDYTVIADPMDKSYELVEGYLNKEKINLIYNIGIQNDILKNHEGCKILYSKDPAMDELFGEKVGDLTTGGSVAHSMTSAAIMMGCNPIIFIGQDFAYTDKKEHSQLANSPWNPDEKIVESNDNIYVESIYGEQVETSKILYQYKCQMEKIIQENSHIKFINATEGGAFIKGAEVKSLKNVITEYINEDDQKINFCKENNINRDVKRRLEVKVEKTIDSIEKLIDLYLKEETLKEYKNIMDKTALMNCKNSINKIHLEINRLIQNILFCNDILYCEQRKCDLNEEYIIKAEDKLDETIIKNIGYKLALHKGFSQVLNSKLPVIMNALDNL